MNIFHSRFYYTRNDGQFEFTLMNFHDLNVFVKILNIPGPLCIKFCPFRVSPCLSGLLIIIAFYSFLNVQAGLVVTVLSLRRFSWYFLSKPNTWVFLKAGKIYWSHLSQAMGKAHILAENHTFLSLLVVLGFPGTLVPVLFSQIWNSALSSQFFPMWPTDCHVARQSRLWHTQSPNVIEESPSQPVVLGLLSHNMYL